MNQARTRLSENKVKINHPGSYKKYWDNRPLASFELKSCVRLPERSLHKHKTQITWTDQLYKSALTLWDSRGNCVILYWVCVSGAQWPTWRKANKNTSWLPGSFHDSVTACTAWRSCIMQDVSKDIEPPKAVNGGTSSTA